MVGYYRHLVPHFATKAESLMSLTKKEKPENVQWTSKEQQSIKILKDRFSGIVTAVPEPSSHVALTIASMLQIMNRHEHQHTH